jgi:hypothetical protein
MNLQIRMTGIEWHPCGPYEYVVMYYGEKRGYVARYPCTRTWYFKNDDGAYGESRNRTQATRDLLSVGGKQ